MEFSHDTGLSAIGLGPVAPASDAPGPCISPYPLCLQRYGAASDFALDGRFRLFDVAQRPSPHRFPDARRSGARRSYGTLLARVDGSWPILGPSVDAYPNTALIFRSSAKRTSLRANGEHLAKNLSRHAERQSRRSLRAPMTTRNREVICGLH
jgi:hypothetical protein